MRALELLEQRMSSGRRASTARPLVLVRAWKVSTTKPTISNSGMECNNWTLIIHRVASDFRMYGCVRVPVGHFCYLLAKSNAAARPLPCRTRYKI